MKQFFVEPGNYRFRVTEAKEDSSKAGNDMLTLTLRIILPDGKDGPLCIDRLVFIDSCYWKVDAFLKSCGQHPGEGVNVDVNAENVIGWEGEAALIVETFEGKKSNKVSAYVFDEF